MYFIPDSPHKSNNYKDIFVKRSIYTVGLYHPAEGCNLQSEAMPPFILIRIHIRSEHLLSPVETCSMDSREWVSGLHVNVYVELKLARKWRPYPGIQTTYLWKCWHQQTWLGEPSPVIFRVSRAVDILAQNVGISCGIHVVWGCQVVEACVATSTLSKVQSFHFFFHVFAAATCFSECTHLQPHDLVHVQSQKIWPVCMHTLKLQGFP